MKFVNPCQILQRTLLPHIQIIKDLRNKFIEPLKTVGAEYRAVNKTVLLRIIELE